MKMDGRGELDVIFDERVGGLHVRIDSGPWFPFGIRYRSLIEVNGVKHYRHPKDTERECLDDMKDALDTMLELNVLPDRKATVETMKRKLETEA